LDYKLLNVGTNQFMLKGGDVIRELH